MSTFKSVNFPGIFLKFYRQIRQYDEDLIKALEENFLALEAMLNRGLNPEDNFDWRLVDFTSDPSIGVETAVPHTLGKIPTDFIVTSIDQEAIVWKGSTPWTSDTIYLKASQSSVAIRAYIFTGG